MRCLGVRDIAYGATVALTLAVILVDILHVLVLLIFASPPSL